MTLVNAISRICWLGRAGSQAGLSDDVIEGLFRQVMFDTWPLAILD